MAGRTFEIPGLGTATMYKRRGMRNVRISVNRSGKIRVNLPKWAPYITAQRFALKNREWIAEQLANRDELVIKDGDIIGHGATVKFEKSAGTRTTTKVSSSSIVIRSPLEPSSEAFQQKARAACERSLKMQAEQALIKRTAQLARQNGYTYGQVSIKRLTSRWGSCSHKGNIVLSLFLMQLPDELIDYVILHELTHTQQMNHGPEFWARLEKSLPSAKQIRKQMKNYQPHLSAKGKFDNIDKADLPLR